MSIAPQKDDASTFVERYVESILEDGANLKEVVEIVRTSISGRQEAFDFGERSLSTNDFLKKCFQYLRNNQRDQVITNTVPITEIVLDPTDSQTELTRMVDRDLVDTSTSFLQLLLHYFDRLSALSNMSSFDLMKSLVSTTKVNHICKFWHSSFLLSLYGLIKMGYNFGLIFKEGDFFSKRDSTPEKIAGFVDKLKKSLNVDVATEDVTIYFMLETSSKSYLFEKKGDDLPTDEDLRLVTLNGDSHTFFKRAILDTEKKFFAFGYLCCGFHWYLVYCSNEDRDTIFVFDDLRRGASFVRYLFFWFSLHKKYSFIRVLCFLSLRAPLC